MGIIKKIFDPQFFSLILAGCGLLVLTYKSVLTESVLIAIWTACVGFYGYIFTYHEKIQQLLYRWVIKFVQLLIPIILFSLSFFLSKNQETCNLNSAIISDIALNVKVKTDAYILNYFKNQDLNQLDRHLMVLKTSEFKNQFLNQLTSAREINIKMCPNILDKVDSALQSTNDRPEDYVRRLFNLTDDINQILERKTEHDISSTIRKYNIDDRAKLYVYTDFYEGMPRVRDNLNSYLLKTVRGLESITKVVMVTQIEKINNVVTKISLVTKK